MNPRMVAVGLVLVSFLWVRLAFESHGRGNLGIGLLQGVVALGFAGRGVWEWIKHAPRD